MEQAAAVAGPATKFRGIVTPHNPRTDENSTFVLMERILNTTLTEIRLWGHPECSWDKIEEFVADGLLPVEIGEVGYSSTGAPSAAESAAVMLGRGRDDLKPSEIKLLDMLARRNRDGYMNQFHMSLPRILKDLYDLPGYDELDLISRFKDIVHAFLEYEDRPEDSVNPRTLLYNYAMRNNDPLSNLDKSTKGCDFSPFTPGGYLLHLCYRDESPDQIREKVEFWINAWGRFQAEFRKAQTEWPRTEKLHFTINGLPAAATETSNRFFAKVCFNKEQADRVDFLVVRNPNGHTAIMTKRRNISALSCELNRLEPGRWHHHESAGQLLNGGPMFPEVTPTSLAPDQLAGLMAKFPPR